MEGVGIVTRHRHRLDSLLRPRVLTAPLSHIPFLIYSLPMFHAKALTDSSLRHMGVDIVPDFAQGPSHVVRV
jgi:hypothetical protein